MKRRTLFASLLGMTAPIASANFQHGDEATPESFGIPMDDLFRTIERGPYETSDGSVYQYVRLSRKAPRDARDGDMAYYSARKKRWVEVTICSPEEAHRNGNPMRLVGIFFCHVLRGNWGFVKTSGMELFG